MSVGLTATSCSDDIDPNQDPGPGQQEGSTSSSEPESESESESQSGSDSDSIPGTDDTSGSSTTTNIDDSSGGDESTTGAPQCEPGMLDCDDRPGCESSSDAAQTCGSCDKSCVLLGTELSCSEGVCSGDVALTEVEDVSTREPVAGNNYNSQPHLWVTGASGNNEHAYVQFPGISALPSDATILDAHLVLDHRGPNPSIEPVQVSVVLGAWQDDLLTWATEPPAERPFTTVMVTEVNPLEIDVLPAVRAWVEGTPNFGLVMTSGIELPPLGGDEVTFVSSEAMALGVDGVAPILEVSLSY